MTSFVSVRCAALSALLTTSELLLPVVLDASVVSPVTRPRSTRAAASATGTCALTSVPFRLTRTLSSGTPAGAVISISASPPLTMSGDDESVFTWNAAGAGVGGGVLVPGKNGNATPPPEEPPPHPATSISALAIARPAAIARGRRGHGKTRLRGRGGAANMKVS
ncbi:hypothetical protein D3C87_1382580 [compost metagenome]